MNIITIISEKLKRNFFSKNSSRISKFGRLLLLSLICLLPYQNASAVTSGCSWEKYSYLDEIKWDPENGVLLYKIRVYQTWGGEANARCCWGEDGDPLTLTQKTHTKHVISIVLNTDGGDAGSTIDGRKLQGKKSAGEDAPAAQGGSDEKTYYYTFAVPVSQEDLGKTISIDLKGHWWKKGISGQGEDEDYNIPDYRKVTLTYPTDPGLKITKAYYDCNNSKPMLNFDWTRKNSSGIAGSGAVYLIDASTDSYVDLPGVVARYAKYDPAPLSVEVSTTDEYHNLNSSYRYKLRHECELITEANGIQETLLYTYESQTVEINACPQVSYINFDDGGSDSKKQFVWKIPNAPSTDYDDSPFLITLKRTVGEDVKEETIEVPYKAGITDYSYEIPSYVGTVNYEFTVERSTFKDMECFKKFKRKVAVDISYGDHLFPKNPKATLTSNNTIKISWGKSGKVWTDGTEFILSKTNLTDSTTTEYKLSKEIFTKGSYVDSVESCSSYTYKIIFKPGYGAEEEKFNIEGEITTEGCPEVYLTIQDGANGKIDVMVEECKTFKLAFEPEKGWSIESVSFNGDDVTEQLQDDLYETPEISENSTISIVYKKDDETRAPKHVNSLSHVWTNNGTIVIGNATLGSSVIISDILGRIVYSGPISSNEETISSLGSGVFIVNVNGEVFKVSL